MKNIIPLPVAVKVTHINLDDIQNTLKAIQAKLATCITNGLKTIGDQMSQVSDAVAALETSFAEVSKDLSALSSQLTNLQQQIAGGSSTLSSEDAAALNQAVTDAATLATAADAIVNPPAQAATS